MLTSQVCKENLHQHSPFYNMQLFSKRQHPTFLLIINVVVMLIKCSIINCSKERNCTQCEMNIKCIRSVPSNSFSHSSCYLMTGPQPLPKQDIHSVRFSVSSFNLQYPFPSLRSSTSCLCLLPRLCSIFPPFLTSIMCIGRQFIHKM